MVAGPLTRATYPFVNLVKNDRMNQENITVYQGFITRSINPAASNHVKKIGLAFIWQLQSKLIKKNVNRK